MLPRVHGLATRRHFNALKVAQSMYVGFMDSQCPRRKSARGTSARAAHFRFLGTFAVFVVSVFTAWISGRFAVFVRSVFIAWRVRGPCHFDARLFIRVGSRCSLGLCLLRGVCVDFR